MLQRAEHPSNTAEQVEQYIRDALELTERLAPPDDLRQIVFAKAVDLGSSKQVTLEQVGASPLVPQLAPH
jgi:hypothetical protein